MIEVYVNGDTISTSQVRFLVACPMCNNAGRDVGEISHPCVSFCKQCNLLPLLSHGGATKCVRGTRLNRCRVTGSELLYLYFTTRSYMYILDASNNIIIVIIISIRFDWTPLYAFCLSAYSQPSLLFFLALRLSPPKRVPNKVIRLDPFCSATPFTRCCLLCKPI